MAHQGEWQEQPTPGPPGPHVSLYHNAAASHHRSGQGRQPSLDAVLKIARISCPVLWEQSTSHTQITRWQEPALQMGSVWLQCWTPSCFMTSDRVPTFLNWKASHLKKKKKSLDSQRKRKEREKGRDMAEAHLRPQLLRPVLSRAQPPENQTQVTVSCH